MRSLYVLNLTCTSFIGCTHPPEMHLYYKGTSKCAYTYDKAALLDVFPFSFLLFQMNYALSKVSGDKPFPSPLSEAFYSNMLSCWILTLSTASKHVCFLIFLKSCCLHHQV